MTTRLDELQNFLNETPNDPFLKYAITAEYRKMGNKQKAREGYIDLVTNHSDYVGTYYHYAKFLEEQGEQTGSLEIYKLGLEVSKRLGNRHAYNELMGAYNLAQGIDEDEDE
ncbi:hypothetical protein [Sphingobacterium sp. JB170]|uniref:hypothetical protein n=1 Tax=Sphingobacterium sp. JB170 TaxID=1434842 RepID=UPI00097F65CE|nr:hypothetical protein [Sphingobacterium sp. JB170]SJN30485.1 tetratricopeptide repeat domain protein [Sphingobacterium sp. JB170]